MPCGSRRARRVEHVAWGFGFRVWGLGFGVLGP